MNRTMPTMFACLAVLAGCGSFASTSSRMARMSAGPTGCAPSAVEVSDEDFDGTYPATWTASCGGERYSCSANAVGPAVCNRMK